MLVFPLRGRRLLLTAGLVLGTSLATAPAASAKTFTAFPKDASGDSVDGPRDIVSSRIAYNRKSGAISISVTMDEEIDGAAHDGILAVSISNLVHGKCTKPIFLVAGMISQPTRVFAERYDGLKRVGKRRYGSGSIDGATFSLRVRNRALAGDTVGCTAVAVLNTDPSKDADSLIYDETAGNDGFI